MSISLSKKNIKNIIDYKLDVSYGTAIEGASDEELFRSISSLTNELIMSKRAHFLSKAKKQQTKKIYYLCMEFLMGRSLRNNLLNLGLYDTIKGILKDGGVNLDNILEVEPDAGLGNGGLGRLAACYLDALASQGYASMGYSICYEYGIFKQKIVDGWQTELPDDWLRQGGDIWLNPDHSDSVEVRFGGYIDEVWENGRHVIKHKDYTTVKAVPYDMLISGYDNKGVSVLRLFETSITGIDMQLFNSGDYASAVGANSASEAISMVLYPNDNHPEGKTLRLKQQYFLTAATVADIIKRHLEDFSTLENLSDKVAIHINDTHPALAIGELMRILVDECGFDWNKAWDTTTQTFAYTNHTVMKEALEEWDCGMLQQLIPRVYQIICEINRRFIDDLRNSGVAEDVISRVAIVWNDKVRMANLSVHASHKVNGVSKLHSNIIKESVFSDFYKLTPEKFTNVTNGIAYRRWLYAGNPELYKYLCELCGTDINKKPGAIYKAVSFADDKQVLDKFMKIKQYNKEKFAKYIYEETGEVIDTNSIFDVQLKRLHEYKRQHLNALNILSLYHQIKQNPSADFVPRTFIFGAKAAPGYYMAKQIIRLIYSIGEMISSDPDTKDKIKILYLNDYNVSKSEILMPASNISEQISLAGTEASGTGNMKLMINGAITIGTLDGANVEICDAVGEENIIIFGMKTDEVFAQKLQGYNPRDYYESNKDIRWAIDTIHGGISNNNFIDIADNLKTSDPYMVLADFDSYQKAQQKVSEIYLDEQKFARMSFLNTANAGVFAADRAVEEYATNIWNAERVL